jgi:uncharacterized membrane protein
VAVLAPPSARRPALAERPELLAVVGITALAALVRFAALGVQSFWFDEALTVGIVERSFGGMLDHVVEPGNAEPPLYFILAWGWTRVFGDGEVGLRSLSALAGTLTVPVAYAAARVVAGRGTAVLTGLLAALSPALVWYSQEARSYALMTLFGALSLLFMLLVLERPTKGRLAGWVAASALGVFSHYFAAFIVVPEAAWLLYSVRDRRRVLAAIAGLALVAAAIAPVLIYQRTHGHPAERRRHFHYQLHHRR